MSRPRAVSKAHVRRRERAAYGKRQPFPHAVVGPPLDAVEAMVATVLPQLGSRGSSGATRPRERPGKEVRQASPPPRPALARDTSVELQFRPQDARALETAFDTYLEYRRQREPLLEDERWRCVLKLQQLLKKHPHVALAGREGALYEELHRSCPQRLCQRTRFIVVMRRVFNYETAPVRGVATDVKELVETVFDAFDEGNDAMPWRNILVMLHVVCYPTREPADHLRWGFALVGSEGSFDMSCKPPFDARIHDAKLLLHAVGHAEMRPKLSKYIDDAWAGLVKRGDQEAADLTRDAETASLMAQVNGKKALDREGNVAATPRDAIKLTRSLFERLLSAPPLQRLFTKSIQFGRADPRTWTYVIEDEQYHPMIAAEIKRARLIQRHDFEATQFAITHPFRQKRRFRGWRSVAQRIRRIKNFTLRGVKKCVAMRCAAKFLTWRREALVELRGLELQRVARGFLGRLEARWVRRIHMLVTGIQSRCRRWLLQADYRRERRLRHWAATEVARHVRGLRARRITLWRLEEKLDREVCKLKKRRILWEKRQEIATARMIQGAFRARRARRETLRRMEEAAARAAAAESMDQLYAENQRKKRIYQNQITEWYALRKEEYLKSTMVEGFDAAQQAKIMRFRRKKEFELEEEKALRAKKLQELLDDERIAGWIQKWERVKIERVAALRKHLEWCQLSPETVEEKKIAKTLNREVKKRTNIVFRRAGAQGHDLELPECEAMALEEILLKRCNDEELVVDAERRAAADAHYLAIEEAEAAERAEKEKDRVRMQNISVFKIQRIRSLHESRVELRRRAYARFTKEYDPEHTCYFYLDKLTKEITWRKPYALGAYDLKVIDEWVLLRDETQTAYYYNPCSQEMTWQRPRGCVFCAVCDDAFCGLHCNDTKRKFCRPCYDDELATVLKEHGKKRVGEMTFKVLRGGDSKSGEADLKKLEDTGLQLEAERRKQEEEDRVARRASVRRSSMTTKPSYVARELERLARGRALKGPDKDQSQALVTLLAAQEMTTSETFSSTELVDKTQRETQVLMTVIEERRQRRRQRDVVEAMEDRAGLRPLTEYRHLTTRHYAIQAAEEEERLANMDSMTYLSHTSGGSNTASWSMSSRGDSYLNE